MSVSLSIQTFFGLSKCCRTFTENICLFVLSKHQKLYWYRDTSTIWFFFLLQWLVHLKERASLIPYWLKKYVSFSEREIIEAKRNCMKKNSLTWWSERERWRWRMIVRRKRSWTRQARVERNIGKLAARQDKTFHKTDIDSVLLGAHVDVNRGSSPECSSKTACRRIKKRSCRRIKGRRKIRISLLHLLAAYLPAFRLRHFLLFSPLLNHIHCVASPLRPSSMRNLRKGNKNSCVRATHKPCEHIQGEKKVRYIIANEMQFFSFLNLNTIAFVPCILTLESCELFYVTNIRRYDVVINVVIFCET